MIEAALMERPAAVATARRARIKVAAVALGLSEGAIRKKLERGIWIEGKHWHRSPDGCIYIDMPAVDRWILGED